MSTPVTAPTYTGRRPVDPVRALLTRDYVGFGQPEQTRDRWLATASPPSR